MGMSLAMGGMIGGLGAGMVNQADILNKEDVANADLGRKKDFEQFLIQAREESGIRVDNRNWQNEQDRAPTKRAMKTADETASAEGKLAFQTEYGDSINAVESSAAEAKQTQADKDEKKARAKYYGATADSIANETGKNAPKEGKDGNGGDKLSADDAAELKAVHARIEKRAEAIDKAKVEGAWDPAKNAGQKSLDTEHKADLLRARSILGKYRGDSKVNTPDPLNQRGQRDVAPQPGMVGAFKGTPEQAISDIEMSKLPPQEKANAIAALREQLQRSGPAAKELVATSIPDQTPKGSTAPAVQTSKVATGGDGGGGDADLSAFKQDPAMDARVQSEQREMGEGKRLQYSGDVKPYVEKVRAVKEMVARQQREAVGRKEVARTKANLGL